MGLPLEAVCGVMYMSILIARLVGDYQQFIENRDWDFRNLGGLIAALEGTRGSYSTTQTTTSKESGGEFAQALGIAATLVGAFYGVPVPPPSGED